MNADTDLKQPTPHPATGLVETLGITVDSIPIVTRSVSEGPRFIPRLRFGLGFPPAPPATLRGKPRPSWLRALGRKEVPDEIRVDGDHFKLQKVFKHDSWAATALYESGDRRIVCKFNRTQHCFGIPMRWLGRRLARREAAHYRRLADVPNVPALCGKVHINGRVADHAVAHEYVEGRPLGSNEIVPESFDRELESLFRIVHQRGLAYVDFHKRENIIVGEDGKPYLIDFQVSWMARDPAHRSNRLNRWLLNHLQAMDRYHLEMHRAHHRRLRNESVPEPERPAWIKAHRRITVPIREARRRFLVWIGVRKSSGHAHSEHFPEQAFCE